LKSSELLKLYHEWVPSEGELEQLKDADVLEDVEEAEKGDNSDLDVLLLAWVSELGMSSSSCDAMWRMWACFR
jgi:hypothetical protein